MLHRFLLVVIFVCLCRWSLWACTLDTMCTCRAAGTSWMACWCLCRSWTSWSPSRQQAEIEFSESSECSGYFEHCDHWGPESLTVSQEFLNQMQSYLAWLWPCVLQGDKQSTGLKTGGGDFDHIFKAHWEYCPHLLCFFYCLWNSRSSGERFHFPFSTVFKL